MPKIRLTDRTIKALQPEANKRIEFHDTLEPALAIRVTQTGTKTFVFCYYWGRNTKRYTIGRYPAYSLVLARQRVSELRVQVSKGIDPSAEKSKNAKARAVQNKPVTISQLAKDFQAGHFSKLKPNTRKGYQSAIQSNIVAVLGNRPVKELTRSELRKFLKTFVVKGHTTTGNRIHAILSKMLNFAVDEEIIKTNPIAGLDKLSSESSRERTYTNEEIRALWDAIELETTP
ncbi:MAG: integrase arm-type DNA-binding domain-containing protein, partial [Balneolales bacterium]|nr:integrase arm-type DNA-binding domain-containing protein [Balneolales bacterium]